MDKEKVVRSHRDKALEFLDNLTKGGDSKKEKEQIEKRIISILQNKEETLEQLESHIGQLKQKEIQLEEEIKMKRIECERAEKRLESIVDVKPKEDSEQRELENELQHLYRLYVEKIRNNDYLENKLTELNEIEKIKEKMQEAENEQLGNNVFANFTREIHDENEGIVYNEDNHEEPFNFQKSQNQKRDQLQTRGDNNRPKQQLEKFQQDDDQEGEEFQNEEEEDEEDEKF